MDSGGDTAARLGWSAALTGPKGWFVLCFAIAASFGVTYIAATLFLGLNGTHVWRQSDSLAHIVSLMQEADTALLETFSGQQIMFDVPIYQGIVAVFSDLFSLRPTVIARLVNLVVFIGILVVSGRLAERVHPGAGPFAWFFIATSPPLLHYSSTPIPDLTVILLSLLAIDAFGSMPFGRVRLVLGAACLSAAALMKAPIPFVFLVYGLTNFALADPKTFRRCAGSVAIMLAVALLSVIASELIRTTFNTRVNASAEGFEWYFGSLSQRLEPSTWLIAIARIVAAVPNNLLFGLGLAATVWAGLSGNRTVMASAAASLLAGLVAWATFTNPFRIHDYYSLPIAILAFLTFSGALSSIVSRGVADARLVYRASVVVPTAAVFLVSGIVMQKQSHFRADDVYGAMRYALAGADRVAWISANGHDAPGPTLGGRIEQEFMRFDEDIPIAECREFPSRFDGIVVSGRTACEEVWVETARSILRGPVYQAFVWSPATTRRVRPPTGPWDRVFLIQRIPAFAEAFRDVE